jgi:hypothetical protein
VKQLVENEGKERKMEKKKKTDLHRASRDLRRHKKIEMLTKENIPIRNDMKMYVQNTQKGHLSIWSIKVGSM